MFRHIKTQDSSARAAFPHVGRLQILKRTVLTSVRSPNVPPSSSQEGGAVFMRDLAPSVSRVSVRKCCFLLK